MTDELTPNDLAILEACKAIVAEDWDSPLLPRHESENWRTREEWAKPRGLEVMEKADVFEAGSVEVLDALMAKAGLGGPVKGGLLPSPGREVIMARREVAALTKRVEAMEMRLARLEAAG